MFVKNFWCSDDHSCYSIKLFSGISVTDLQVISVTVFFSRGHGNEFNNLIGSLCGPDFPISAHGHHNAYVSLMIDSSLSLSFFIDLREWGKKINKLSPA